MRLLYFHKFLIMKRQAALFARYLYLIIRRANAPEVAAESVLPRGFAEAKATILCPFIFPIAYEYARKRAVSSRDKKSA